MLTAGFDLFLPALLLMFMYTNVNPFLGRIQKFVEGGSDTYPPKAAHPSTPGSEGMLPGKKFKIWVNRLGEAFWRIIVDYLPLTFPLFSYFKHGLLLRNRNNQDQ